MFCKKCGAKIEAGKNFCSKCGAKVRDSKVISNEDKASGIDQDNTQAENILVELEEKTRKTKEPFLERAKRFIQKNKIKLIVIGSIIFILVGLLIILNLGKDVTMPNIIGKTIERAQTILEDEGFNNYKITTNTWHDDNIVTSQSLEPKTVVNNHDELIIEVESPSSLFLNKNLETTKQRAEKWGWRVKIYNQNEKEINIKGTGNLKKYQVTKVMEVDSLNNTISFEVDTIKNIEAKKAAAEKERKENEAKERAKKLASGNARNVADAYEDFVDEYVEFMKKYKNSSDPTSMLPEYTRYMNELSNIQEKMKNIDTSKLSDEDRIYCLEVYQRALRKLADVAG